MVRHYRLHAVLLVALLVVSSVALGGVAFGQLTDTESNSLQTGTASVITANDSTDGDGNWSQPRANAARTGATNDDGPLPYGNVSWSTNEYYGGVGGPIVVGDTVIGAYSGTFEPGGYVRAYDESNGTLLWTRSNLSDPVGSPTSMNGTVFVSVNEANSAPDISDPYFDRRNGLYALDPESGATEWRWNESVTAPLAADGRLYVSVANLDADPNRYQNFTAVDPATGQRLWTSDVEGKPLAAADGQVILGSEADDTLAAVDAANGSVLWRTSLGPEFVLEEDVAATDDGVYVTIGATSNPDLDDTSESLAKVAADTGAVEWRRNLSQYMTSTMRSADRISAPAVANGTVYVTTGDEMFPPDTRHGTVHALDAASGTAEWHFHTKAQLGSAPAVANGTVYSLGSGVTVPSSGSGVAYALDARTGAEQWNLSIPSMAFIPNSIAVEDDRLFFVTYDSGMIPTATIRSINATDERPPPHMHPMDDQDFHPIDYDPTAIVDVEPPADGERYAPNTSVMLDGSESNEPNGNISTYEWDLDDDGQYETTGETATVRTSSVPCDIIRVTLRVTDDDGETDEETVIIQTEDD